MPRGESPYGPLGPDGEPDWTFGKNKEAPPSEPASTSIQPQEEQGVSVTSDSKGQHEPQRETQAPIPKVVESSTEISREIVFSVRQHLQNRIGEAGRRLEIVKEELRKKNDAPLERRHIHGSYDDISTEQAKWEKMLRECTEAIEAIDRHDFGPVIKVLTAYKTAEEERAETMVRHYMWGVHHDRSYQMGSPDDKTRIAREYAAKEQEASEKALTEEAVRLSWVHAISPRSGENGVEIREIEKPVDGELPEQEAVAILTRPGELYDSDAKYGTSDYAELGEKKLAAVRALDISGSNKALEVLESHGISDSDLAVASDSIRAFLYRLEKPVQAPEMDVRCIRSLLKGLRGASERIDRLIAGKDPISADAEDFINTVMSCADVPILQETTDRIYDKIQREVLTKLSKPYEQGPRSVINEMIELEKMNSIDILCMLYTNFDHILNKMSLVMNGDPSSRVIAKSIEVIQWVGESGEEFRSGALGLLEERLAKINNPENPEVDILKKAIKSIQEASEHPTEKPPEPGI